jgi:hypothetical protein
LAIGILATFIILTLVNDDDAPISAKGRLKCISSESGASASFLLVNRAGVALDNYAATKGATFCWLTPMR